MENQKTTTLGSIMNPSGQPQKPQHWQVSGNNSNYTTFLTVFSLNLSHRYPDISDLNLIETDEIQKIAEFSAACSGIAFDTWGKFNSSSSDVQRYRKVS